MNWLLVAVLAIPAAGALAAAAIPRDLPGRVVGTVAAALAFLATLALPLRRTPFHDVPDGGADASGLAPVQPWHDLNGSWVPALDLRFHLGVDGISYPLVLLTALLTLLCCGYSLWRVPETGPEGPRNGRLLVALLLVIDVGITGVFLALDMVLFFVFFELVLLPMYAIIAGWGGPDRRRASRKFVLYTLFGSVLLLVGLLVVTTSAGTADIVELTAAAGTGMSQNTQLLAFVLLALGFAVKSPLWPLHTWLPDAHTEAPTVGSVILAGVLLKMGTYGLLRIGVGVTPDAARDSAPVLGILAVTAIIVGGLVCLAQTELKRLIAYSSVGHMGFVLLGIATFTATGFQASLIGNIAHGLITGLLFFLAGAIKDRAHTGDLGQLGGLRETAPGLAGLLGFAAIASLGLPGLAGFWGEAFAVVAALDRGGVLWRTLAVVAAVGAAITAAYFMRLLRRATHGPASPVVGALGTPRLSRVELLAWAPLVVLIVLVGLIPALVLTPGVDPVQGLFQVVAGD